MDSNRNRSDSDLPDLRRVRIVYKGREISYAVSDNMDFNGFSLEHEGLYTETPTYLTLYISGVADNPPKFWGVRIGYLLAGVALSWMIQFGLAVVLTGG